MTPKQSRQPATRPASVGIELVELETFIAVVQAESFSAAAQRLHVSQPTVTGRIQRLEAALGTRLLDRTTRKMEPTADGLKLWVHASKALEGLNDLVHGFRERARKVRQRVVVAATPTLAALLLPGLLQGYARRYPDVEVVLLDLRYAGLLGALDDGSADLGLMAYKNESGPYLFEPLWDDDMLLMVPRGHPLVGTGPVEAAQFAHFPLILVDQHQGLRDRIGEALETAGFALPAPQVVRNLNTLLGMLNEGMGISLLPRSMATRPEVAGNVLLEIGSIDLTRAFGIVRSRRGEQSLAARSFCDYVRAEIPGLLARTRDRP